MVPFARGHLLPALVVAYPATFSVLQTRPYCPEGCAGFGLVDVVAVTAVLAVSVLAALAVAAGIDRSRWSDHRSVRATAGPSNATLVVLPLLYLALVGFFALDAAGAGGVWKGPVLLTSLIPYAPVWLLYAGTFYLAYLLSLLGGASSPTLTLLVRATLVVVGFGGTPVWQFWLSERLSRRLGGRGE